MSWPSFDDRHIRRKSYNSVFVEPKQKEKLKKKSAYEELGGICVEPKKFMKETIKSNTEDNFMPIIESCSQLIEEKINWKNKQINLGGACVEFNSPLTPFKIELVNDKIDLIAKSDTIPRIESCSQEIEDESNWNIKPRNENLTGLFDVPAANEFFIQPPEHRKNKKLGMLSEKLLARIRLRTSERNIHRFQELATRPRIYEKKEEKNCLDTLTLWGVGIDKTGYPFRCSQEL